MRKRGLRWPFLFAFLVALAAVSVCHSGSVPESPIVTHKDNNSEREFQNVYQAIQNPTINTAIISSATIGNLTVTGTLNSGTRLAQPPIECQTTNAFSTTSNTFQNTNLSCSITPVSTLDKILVIASGRLELAANNHVAYITLARGTTNLGGSLGLNQLSMAISAGAINAGITVQKLDSPSTTSAVTYTVQIKNDDNATTVDYIVANQPGTMVLLDITGSGSSSSGGISSATVSNWSAWTPAFTGLGTVTNISFFWRRLGENMEIQGIATAGTVTGGTSSFSLPNSLVTNGTVVKALNAGGDFSVVGSFGVKQNSGNATFVLADAGDNLLFFGSGSGSSSSINGVTGSSGFTSNATFTVHASVPISGWSF